jgi:hypothetical protein
MLTNSLGYCQVGADASVKCKHLYESNNRDGIGDEKYPCGFLIKREFLPCFPEGLFPQRNVETYNVFHISYNSVHTPK